MIEERILSHGLRLVAETTAANDIAAVGVWYDRGSRNDPNDSHGAAHFIEHMLFKGAATRTSRDIARVIDRIGGNVNAFTEKETVALHAQVPNSKLTEAIDLLAEMATVSVFSEAEFTTERRVILDELSAAGDDPEEAAADSLSEALWPGHSLSRSVGGTLASVAKLRRDSIYNYYLSSFSKSPALVSVVGARDIDAITHQLDEYFTGSYSPPIIKSPPLIDITKYSIWRHHHVQLFIVYQLPGRLNTDEYYALELANTAFGDAYSSRLFQTLREEAGLCYSVGSNPVAYSDFYQLVIYATCSPITIYQTIAAMIEQIELLRQGELVRTELDDAASHLKGALFLAANDPEYRMRRNARRALYGLPILDRDGAVNAINQQVSQANTILKKVLSHSASLFAIGPARGRFAFYKAAKDFLCRVNGVDDARL